MAFVSAAFVAFMAIVGLLYFAMPEERRWIVLLVASYVFFFINSHWLIVVLFIQTLVTFMCGRQMASIDEKMSSVLEGLEKKELREVKTSIRKRKSRWMLVGIIFNVGALLFLKYNMFFVRNINVIAQLFGAHISSLGLLVPIGISFYTLQAIAYVVDVQRGKVVADKSLPQFMLFMSYFPQILQGPIARYDHLAHQLYEGHSFEYKRLGQGAQLILWGFIKKLVIADRLAIPVNQIFDNWMYYDGPIVFLAAMGYGLQVYADFSGGIDIARGFSQILGISLTDNFRQPYFSRSIEDFWRRWHITLGAWMKDYIFYPLSLCKLFSRIGKTARKLFGTSIGKKVPPFIAMFVVFLLVGLWHGAKWKYIMFGIWNGVFIMFGILLADQYDAAKKKCHIREDSMSWVVFQIIRTILICSIGRFFSRADSFMQSIGMMRHALDGWYDWSFLTDGSLTYLGLDFGGWLVLLAGILVLFFVDLAHERGYAIREAISREPIVARWIIYIAAFFVALILGVYGVDYNSAAFIYQQF